LFFSSKQKLDKEGLDHLNSLSPSAVDAEFRLLHLDQEYYELRLVIDFLTFHLDSNANFDVVQAYLNLFLKVLPPFPSPLFR